MVAILWEIVLPLLIAFVVGWVVMGWLTWRWRRTGVSMVRWRKVNDELATTRSELELAMTRVADLEAAPAPVSTPAGVNGNGSNGKGSTGKGSTGNGHTPAGDDTGSAPVDAKPVDDLKAIRGVGLKMEAKLNELGITSLRQVADFDDEEVERVSAGLGAFPGRIERDRWVEQARDLVARLETERS